MLMAKLRKYNIVKIKTILAFIYFITLVGLLSFGCSSQPTIIEKHYPVYLPGSHHTIELVQDTIHAPVDSNAYWSGDVKDSLKNVIGWLKVYYNKKIAELRLHPRIDSVIVHDTIPSKPNTIIETTYGLLPSWAQITLMLVTGLLLYFSASSQIKTPIIDLLKKLFKWNK